MASGHLFVGLFRGPVSERAVDQPPVIGRNKAVVATGSTTSCLTSRSRASASVCHPMFSGGRVFSAWATALSSPTPFLAKARTLCEVLAEQTVGALVAAASPPATTAASCLDRPAAISRQNRHRCSLSQTDGRPREDMRLSSRCRSFSRSGPASRSAASCHRKSPGSMFLSVACPVPDQMQSYALTARWRARCEPDPGWTRRCVSVTYSLSFVASSALGRPERNQDRSNLAVIIDWPSRRVVC